MNHPSKYLVTAALPYANGPLHVGHLAGAYLPADIYVRFLRLIGKDVVFICGSDEHGAAITLRAAREGISPKEIIDKYHDLFKSTFEQAEVSFDIYHRTSAPLHHETSREFFRTLYNKNEFTEKTTQQYFDPEAKQFLADRYITGTCPKCGHDEAYGDQCENCGSSLSPTDLIDPKSTITGSKPELRETTHWYLPLDKYQDWLTTWITDGTIDGKVHHYPDEWKNHVLGQCKSWLDGGLEPRAMTRDLSWGVDVPAEIPGAEGKKLYVWMDAPIGYISATKAWAEAHAAELEHGADTWKDYWQNEDCSLIHFIGKDNIVFHCLIFPAILKAHGAYNLPVNVPANQFMNLEGRKISTSKNWAVWVNEFCQDMPQYVDVLRYYLTRNMPEQKDSEFTWAGFQEANNNELVNNLANFINRVQVLTHKYYEGVIPEVDESLSITDPHNADEFTYLDAELLRVYDYLFDYHQAILAFDFRAALKAIMELSSYGNQVLQNNEPWKVRKAEPEMVRVVMFLCNQVTASLSLMIRPFMPHAAERLRDMLNLPEIKEDGELLELMNTLAEGAYPIPAGHQLNPSSHLFTKIADDVINVQQQKLYANDVAEEAPQDLHYEPLKDEIQFGDFMKLDLRTGTIVSAEKMKKADKLLKLTVDLGFEKRIIVSGIAQHFNPEDIIGKRVSVVANLAPKALRGVESNGMILMSEDTEGHLSFVSPPNGASDGMVIR